MQGPPGDFGEGEEGSGVGQGVGAAPSDGVIHVTVVHSARVIIIQALS